MGLPLKLEIARVIAENIAINGGVYSGVAEQFIENLDHWAERDWEKDSPCWRYIVENMPDITKVCTENVQTEPK